MVEVAIATRGSELAIAQARLVASLLESTHPGLRTRLVEISTTGDEDRTTPVSALTEIGAFVRSIQRAVIDGVADVAVHSCKDLPTSGPPELEAVYPQRAAPWDVLCGSTIEGLEDGARIGTGSPRRSAQLSQLRPDLRIEGVRGNVDTRLGHVASGRFDGVVLAEAGLSRLGRLSDATYRFSIDEMVPAPAQGALAVEARRGTEARELLEAIDDPGTRMVVEAERRLLELTGAGCRAALGALGSISPNGVSLSGFVSDERGPRRGLAEGASPSQAAFRLQKELGL